MAVGVAILGGGIFAREEHLPAIEASKDLQLKAVYSRSFRSAKSLNTKESEVDLYSDDSGGGKGLVDLLKRTDISAVVIALPIVNQPEYVRQALLAGKHVLSEKPIAENLSDAVKLIEWYRKEIAPKGVTWGVAENFRYLHNLTYAAEQIANSGPLLGFRVTIDGKMSPDNPYYNTAWRKDPTHQGGFLLDGGVHDAAALRRLLGPGYPVAVVSAFTTQLSEYLPPVDTIAATLRLKNGVVGTFSMSHASPFKRGSSYEFGTEKGVIGCDTRGSVTVGDDVKEIKNERTGVPTEIRAWGEALVAGKPNALQSPEEALADLEILEACLKSGQQGGSPIELQYQIL